MSNSNSDFFGDLFASCCGERKPKKVSPAKLKSSPLAKPVPSSSSLASTQPPLLASSSPLFNESFFEGIFSSFQVKTPGINPSPSTNNSRTALKPSFDLTNNLCGDLMSL